MPGRKTRVSCNPRVVGRLTPLGFLKWAPKLTNPVWMVAHMLAAWAASVHGTGRVINTLAEDPGATSLSLEHILFGVMTSGVNSRRARAVKATWCGADLIKCVFFSETADTAKEVQPVVAFYVRRCPYPP